jgi:hypothetical protein
VITHITVEICYFPNENMPLADLAKLRGALTQRRENTERIINTMIAEEGYQIISAVPMQQGKYSTIVYGLFQPDGGGKPPR